MVIKNNLTKKVYRRLLIRDLLFGSKFTVIMLVLYFFLWRMADTITKIGQLKTNIPIFLGICFLLLLVLTYLFIRYRKHMKHDFLFQSQIELTKEELVVLSNDRHVFPLSSLKLIKENKKCFFLYFKDSTFIPVSKENQDVTEQLNHHLKPVQSIYPTFVKITVVLLLLISAVGIQNVYHNGTDFNGDLARFIRGLKTDTKIQLESYNFFETRLDGILEFVEAKLELEPHLMTSDLEIEFTRDGTLTSIYTYIYGFDENTVLQSGYLIDYDHTKDNKVTVHKQDWDGNGTKTYDPNNDLSIVTNILENIPLEKQADYYSEENYAVLYKGIRDWHSNEGIIFIYENGEMSTSVISNFDITGPTVSFYVPGKEELITPERYVYRN